MTPQHYYLAALASMLSAPIAQASSNGIVPHAAKLSLAPCKITDFENNKRSMLCGTYSVYENRSTRKGRVLPLKVIVVPARSGKSQGPIFMFAGGPSEAATGFARWLPLSWESENHDSVLIDMRGTGEGHSLDCRLWKQGEPLQKFFLTGADGLLSCAKELSKVADLSQYSTPNFVRDVDDVRAALGYNKIILRGFSYGSRSAMTYIKMFGKNVQMAMLSHLAPFENRLHLSTPRETQDALDALVADCAADPKCKAAYPDPAGDLALVRSRLQQRPAKLTVKHPATGDVGEIILSDRWFTRLLAERLSESNEARRIPLLLSQAKAGDFGDIVKGRLADGGEGRARGLRASILCNEDVSRIRLDELERETNGVLSDLGMYNSMYLCAKWPTTKLPRNHDAPFKSNVPTLLVSGDRDPLTGQRWGEVMHRSLPNSAHIVLAEAHDDRPEACISSIGKQFLRLGSVEGLDTSCIASMRRPPFALPQ